MSRQVSAQHLLCSLLICFVVGDTLAAQDKLTELLRAIALEGRQVVGFEEKRVAFYLDEPVSLSGRLVFQPPTVLEKYIEKPQHRVLRITGSTLTTTGADGKTVQIDLRRQPVLLQLSTTLLALLSGDQKRLQRDYTMQLQKHPQSWELRLVPREARLQQWVREVVVSGSGVTISTIKTTEVNGDYSLIRIFIVADE